MLSQFSTAKQAELNLITDTLASHPDVHLVILFEPTSSAPLELEHQKLLTQSSNSQTTNYHLLVILKHHAIHLQTKLTDKVAQATIPSKKYLPRPKISLIFHGIKDVNAKLTAGNSFFTHIKNTGIILYNSEKYSLHAPTISARASKKTNKKRSSDKRGNSEVLLYLTAGNNFYRGYLFFLEQAMLFEAIFLLHQTLESYFTATLIHYTDYRPKEHNLPFLLDRLSGCEPALNIFSDLDEFDLLEQAYVSARYHRDSYTITKEQLLNIEQKICTFYEIITDILE